MISMGTEELLWIILALLIGNLVFLVLYILHVKSDIKKLKEEVDRVIRNFTL